MGYETDIGGSEAPIFRGFGGGALSLAWTSIYTVQRLKALRSLRADMFWELLMGRQRDFGARACRFKGFTGWTVEGIFGRRRIESEIDLASFIMLCTPPTKFSNCFGNEL